MAQVLIFTECNGIHGFGRDLGAYSVASGLRQAGYSVQVIDFFSFVNASRFQVILDRFVDTDTLMVGFSSTHITTLLPEDLEDFFVWGNLRSQHLNAWNTYFPFPDEVMQDWFEQIRAKAPNCKIVVGGQKTFRKVLMQQKYPQVDLWLGGYAEAAILDYLESVQKAPVSFKKNRAWAGRHLPADESFASRSFFWDETDGIFPQECLPLEISRGCNFDCAFCDYPKKPKALDWTRDWEVLRVHLIENYERFGTRSYMLADSLVNESAEKMRKLYELFRSLPFEAEWSGFFRLDLAGKYPEMIDWAVESGAKSLQLGIESLNPQNHKFRIGKQFEFETIQERLNDFRRRAGRDLILGSGFILGLPGDTEEDVKFLLDWLASGDHGLDAYEICPLFIGSYHPDRQSVIHFSRIQKDPAAYGYEVRLTPNGKGMQEDWRNRFSGLSKSRVWEMLDEFQKRGLDQKRLVPNWVIYGRVRNLGFSHAECLDFTFDHREFLSRSVKEYKKLANQYFARWIQEEGVNHANSHSDLIDSYSRRSPLDMGTLHHGPGELSSI